MRGLRLRGFARRVVPTVGGSLGVLWIWDNSYGHQVCQRTARALGVGAWLVWQYKVNWTPETAAEVHAIVAQRLVACLRENEGLYVKFGQALASMDIILPEEYRQELRCLHDRAATFSYPEVRRVVEADLGRPLEEVFSHFEVEPIASASIAQVHRARLRRSSLTEEEQAACAVDEVDVAVKVQKPNIPVQNGCDLAVYRLVLEAMERFFELPLAWTYSYTCNQLEAELDFRIEAANSERCAAELAECPALCDRVTVPGVFKSVSGQRSMTMEWIDCLAPVSDHAALVKAGLSPSEVMKTAIQLFGYQIFSTGNVHCDPHPGNLLLRWHTSLSSQGPNWQLVLLDHGLYCQLPDQLRRQYADFWVSTALGDHEATVRICKEWGVADAEASELLASLTQFRRVRLDVGKINAITGLFGEQPKDTAARQRASLSRHSKLSKKEVAEAQARLKTRAKKVLADTRAFPQELLFVGRNLNMIRSANFSLGRAVNRIAILAECAAAGSAVHCGELSSKSWRAKQFSVLKFHVTVRLVLALDGFFRAWRGACSCFERGMALLLASFRPIGGPLCPEE